MAVEVVLRRAKVRRAARGVFMVGFDGGFFYWIIIMGLLCVIHRGKGV